MANGPERLTRWLLGHSQPKPYCLDIEHPAIDDIAWAADRIEMLESHIETWTSDYNALAKKLDLAERRIAELEQWEPDLSLYGKGEPKSLKELKASHDRLLCTCPRDSTLIEKSCPVHRGWCECTCPPEWTAQCQSSACPRHLTKNTRDWL